MPDAVVVRYVEHLEGFNTRDVNDRTVDEAAGAALEAREVREGRQRRDTHEIGVSVHVIRIAGEDQGEADEERNLVGERRHVELTQV